jgi:hypothetical protein
MAAAENQARLNICLRDIITFFEEAGVQPASIEILNSFLERHLTTDFLALAEGFGKCMAFINHNELIKRILEAYNTLLNGYNIERKGISKRIRLLKEDKRADPEILAKQEHLLSEVDQKKAQAITVAARLRAMNYLPVEMFKDDKFDPIHYYDKNIEKPQIVRKK